MLDKLWAKYEMIKYYLVLAGVRKLPKREELEKLIESGEIHPNKLKIAHNWIEKYLDNQIKAWKKIRNENTEEYWDNAEIMEWGDDFLEVKAMRVEHKRTFDGWKHKDNVLYHYNHKKAKPK